MTISRFIQPNTCTTCTVLCLLRSYCEQINRQVNRQTIVPMPQLKHVKLSITLQNAIHTADVGFDLVSLLAGTWELLCGGDFPSPGLPGFWAVSTFLLFQALTGGGGAGTSLTGSSLCTGESGLLGSSLPSSPPEKTSWEWLDFSLSFLGRPWEGPITLP